MCCCLFFFLFLLLYFLGSEESAITGPIVALLTSLVFSSFSSLDSDSVVAAVASASLSTADDKPSDEGDPEAAYPGMLPAGPSGGSGSDGTEEWP